MGCACARARLLRVPSNQHQAAVPSDSRERRLIRPAIIIFIECPTYLVSLDFGAIASLQGVCLAPREGNSPSPIIERLDGPARGIKLIINVTQLTFGTTQYISYNIMMLLLVWLGAGVYAAR